jgi:DNA-binding IclR family transcriptional regulator
MDDDRPQPNEIQAVSRAAQILALFAPDTPEITPAVVAARLGLNRSTAHRYCTSLAAAGLLDRGHEQGSWAPGGLLLQLGAYAIGRRRVLDLAPTHMRGLAAAAHLTSVLSLWGSGGPVVFRVEEDVTQTVMVTVRVGTHLALDSAQAAVFMAFHSDQLMMNRIMSGVPRGERERLANAAEQVRASGSSVVVNASGVVAMAAPIFDEYGICATIAVIGTDRTLSANQDATELVMLANTAQSLTKEMGGRFPRGDV